MTALSRRSFLTGIGPSGAGVLLAACGGPGSTASSPTSAGARASAGAAITGTANFYHWRSEDKAVIDTLAASFAEKYPGASITQTIDPSDQYQSTVAQKARDGSIGDALTAFRGTQFGQFSDQGIFADLTGASYTGNYVANLIAPGAAGDKQLGFPYQLIFNMPLLNTEIADKAGVSDVPTDWDAYIAALEKFKAAGVDPIAWPGNDPASAFGPYPLRWTPDEIAAVPEHRRLTDGFDPKELHR